MPTPKDMLPLNDDMYYILRALLARTLHGYGIILQVKEDTSNQLTLTTGTLYNVLKRLQRSKVIKTVSPPSNASIDERQIPYYELTSFGRSVCLAEMKRRSYEP